MYSLEVYGLTKRFGNTTVVNGINFSVQSGESFAFVGPLGSGKTTILRLLSGLEFPDEGHIVINGMDMTSVAAADRNIGLIFQNSYGLIPQLDVFECIALSFQHGRSLKKDLVKQSVTAVAQNLHIEPLLERKINTLSNGEQLRVALARVLVKKPQLYIFDEPFMSLDTPTHLAIRREIIEIQRATHIPFLYMTRDQPEAFALANRVAVINQGEIQQIGTRAELMNAPATLWVAQWLGFPPMNTISGHLQGTYRPEGLCYRVWSKSMTPLLPVKWTNLLRDLPSPEVIVGIRPEDIIPEWEFPEKWKSSMYAIRVGVLASEWNQGKTLAQLQLPHVDDKFMAIFDVPHSQVKMGQMLTVAFDSEQICLFDPHTEKLLSGSFAKFSENRNTGR